jgi:hypothetical protein
MRLLSGVAILGLVSGGDAPAPRPRITPFFSSIESSPAFMVECMNATGEPISSNARPWHLEYRVDGNSSEPRGTLGPGLGKLVQPGEVWRGILTLRQTPGAVLPAVVLGTHVRSTQFEPVSPGRHTISVRCGGVWSDDAEFYWANEATGQHGGSNTKPANKELKLTKPG